MKKINCRKTLRIKNYDYSQAGKYFITICTENRLEILSRIDINERRGRSCACPKIELYNYGKIIDEEIQKINKKYENIEIEKYVIMPNHIHLIIEIRAGTRPAPTINYLIMEIKSITTNRYIKEIKRKFQKRIWQRNYYEHIIRNEKEYLKIYEYIDNNPLKWEEDKYNRKG